MDNFEHRQELWILHKPGIYRPRVSDCISRCIYNRKHWSDDPWVKLIRPDGELGMGMAIGDSKLFATLEELKKYLIAQKSNEINDLQRKINFVMDDIEYIQSLKDVKEDREKKLNNILNESHKKI